MKAIIQRSYGSPEVLNVVERPALSAQSLGDGEMLVEVHATSVTTADWRFRAAAFPVGMRLIGRLVSGLFRPRNELTGREFAGRITAVGAGVTRFAVGDEIYGVNPTGVNAETIVVTESAPVVRKPAALSLAEAAAMPFGGLTAVHFVREVAKVRPGERVLVVGASGGVGVYAVQMAKHLGAEVTAVCSANNFELARELGADHVIDYRQHDPSRLDRTWDVIIDAVGKSTFADYRDRLAADGRHVFIEAGVREIWQSLVTPWQRGPTVLFDVGSDSVAGLEALNELVERGALRPVIGQRFVMDEIVEAHRVVEGRHRRGAVIIDVVAEQHRPVELASA